MPGPLKRSVMIILLKCTIVTQHFHHIDQQQLNATKIILKPGDSYLLIEYLMKAINAQKNVHTQNLAMILGIPGSLQFTYNWVGGIQGAKANCRK